YREDGPSRIGTSRYEYDDDSYQTRHEKSVEPKVKPLQVVLRPMKTADIGHVGNGVKALSGTTADIRSLPYEAHLMRFVKVFGENYGNNRTGLFEATVDDEEAAIKFFNGLKPEESVAISNVLARRLNRGNLSDLSNAAYNWAIIAAFCCMPDISVQAYNVVSEFTWLYNAPMFENIFKHSPYAVCDQFMALYSKKEERAGPNKRFYIAKKSTGKYYYLSGSIVFNKSSEASDGLVKTIVKTTGAVLIITIAIGLLYAAIQTGGVPTFNITNVASFKDAGMGLAGFGMLFIGGGIKAISDDYIDSRWKYKSASDVEKELKRRKKLGLENHHTALKSPVAQGGDAGLLLAAQRFGVELPKKHGGSDALYKTKTEARAAMHDRVRRGLSNVSSALQKSEEEGGNWPLYMAMRRFEIPFPREDRSRYQTKKSVLEELSRRKERGLANNSKALQAPKGQGGEKALYRAAMRLGVLLPVLTNDVYKTEKDVRKELARREKSGLANNPAALSRPKSQDGDYALLEAAEKFGVALPMLKERRYTTKSSVKKEILRRAREGLSNNAGALQGTIEEGGDRGLYSAAMKFKIRLPKITQAKYASKRSVQEALKARRERGLANTGAVLGMRRVEDGGDPALKRAADKFGVKLPRGKPGNAPLYVTEESVIEELARREIENIGNSPADLWRSRYKGGDVPLLQ
ncbi:MAG TPA: hypothetical protein PLV52_05165, partial [Candidatus Omnitrophota bacterium]|nr:hypothetical protein [Candidatus Omnitrophota bacterium]